MVDKAPSKLTKLRRAHNRGRYDKETIYTILDAGVVCHVGFSIEGQPFVTPMNHWREGNRIYFHGSSANRTLSHLASGAKVCLTVTHLDGIVLARSGFCHSVNFRSAMLFGAATEVVEPEAKERHLKAFMDRLFPGRWETLRPIKDKELKATKIVWIEIDEASAKVRAGKPNDDEEDYNLPVWAGVLPINTVIGEPEPCSRLDQSVAQPEYLRDFKLG